MAWNTITFPYGSILTSSKMTNMFDNFAALADQSSGAPTLWNAYKWTNGFDMDDVTNVDSPLFVEAMAVHPGRCIDSSNVQVMKLNTSITKMVGSGYTYSFGESGGSVPSSFQSVWPRTSSLDTVTWYHMFLMKNTQNGSMDWGIDTDILSASNLLTEVNSVNGGGWDTFRRIGSLKIYDAHKFISFKKRGNICQRNSGLSFTASVTAITSWFEVPKVGPTGVDCLVNLEFKSNDRAVNDLFYVTPYGQSSYNQDYGLYGLSNGFNRKGQSIALMTNSGNCECRVSSEVLNANFSLNWWQDPFND